MPAKPLKDTFKAKLEKKSYGKESKLDVTGQVETPTTGWKVHLKRAAPQGINPKILILDVVAQAPSGPAGDIVERLRVEYSEDAAEGQFTEVAIRGDGVSFQIPVT